MSARKLDRFVCANDTWCGIDIGRIVFELARPRNRHILIRMESTPLSPVFIDFEASSLSSESWPIEVGIAEVVGQDVATRSRLIRPHPSWPLDDWSEESAEVHRIPLRELEGAEPAEAVTQWLLHAVAGRLLLSDAPEFDQYWLDRLVETIEGGTGPQIRDFDQAVWSAFTNGGDIHAPAMQRVYAHLANRNNTHRAGEDAAELAYAWRAGLLNGNERMT